MQGSEHGPEVELPAARLVPVVVGEMHVADKSPIFAHSLPRVGFFDVHVVHVGQNAYMGKLALFDVLLSPCYGVKEVVFVAVERLQV